MLIAASPLSARCRVRAELRAAEFDLAAAVQEDAEDDKAGVGRDLGGDLMPGPVAGSGDEGEVVLRIVPGILYGWSLPPPSFADDAEPQSGAVEVGGAQVAPEGDGAAAVVVRVDLLAEGGESGGARPGRRRPACGGAAPVCPRGARGVAAGGCRTG